MRRSIVVLTLAAALTAPCALAAGASRPARPHQRPALRPFSGCAELMAYVRRPALALVTSYGIDGVVGPTGVLPPFPGEYAAGPPYPVEGVDYSGTNVQGPGVGEPDLITSDGRTLFTVAGGRLEAVALRGSAARTLGALALPAGDHQLLRDGTRSVVITRTFDPPPQVLLPSPPSPAGAPRPAMAPIL